VDRPVKTRNQRRTIKRLGDHRRRGRPSQHKDSPHRKHSKPAMGGPPVVEANAGDKQAAVYMPIEPKRKAHIDDLSRGLSMPHFTFNLF